jgi:glutathione peroxidase-family protein
MMDPGERISCSPDIFITKEHHITINGHLTHIIAQKYTNRLFIIVTQCNSFGTLLSVTKEEVDALQPDNADVRFSIEVLIGVEDPIYKVLARKAASVIFKDCNIPILFSVALKDQSKECFTEIVNGLAKVDVWSLF